MQSQFSNYPTENADVNGLIVAPGNARFRHAGLSCNVLFADGSVRRTLPASGENRVLHADVQQCARRVHRLRLPPIHADDQMAWRRHRGFQHGSRRAPGVHGGRDSLFAHPIHGQLGIYVSLHATTIDRLHASRSAGRDRRDRDRRGIALADGSQRANRAEALCESNLRALSRPCYQYTLEYNGRYPYGFIFNNQNANNGRPLPGQTQQISWYSSLDKYLTAGSTANFPTDGTSPWVDGSTKRRFSAAFRCPAVASNFQQQISYYQHAVVMPHMTLELGWTTAGHAKVTAPAKTSQVNNDTARLWDTQTWRRGRA